MMAFKRIKIIPLPTPLIQTRSMLLISAKDFTQPANLSRLPSLIGQTHVGEVKIVFGGVSFFLSLGFGLSRQPLLILGIVSVGCCLGLGFLGLITFIERYVRKPGDSTDSQDSHGKH